MARSNPISGGSKRRLALLPLVVTFTGCFAALCTSGAGRVAAETIRVKVYVDEEQPQIEQVWQQQLQARIDAASAILSAYCDLEFSVTSFGRWTSDDRVNDFNKSLREFEQEASPLPAQIAIGFSSQYQFQRGVNHLGGTRGPLHSHILLREGSRGINEQERLEVVVHELGHFLGAAHSQRSDSVMRSVLGDGQARARSFRIQFDPYNAAVIRLVSAEVIDHRARYFGDLTLATQAKLFQVYRQLDQQNPSDPVAGKYAAVLQQSLLHAQRARQIGQGRAP